MKLKHLLLSTIGLFLVQSVTAQQIAPQPGTVEYDKLKAEGKLGTFQPFIGHPGGTNLLQEKIQPVIQPNTPQGGPQCTCLQPIDGSFTIAPFAFGTPPEYRNDDGSTGEIPIPFTFCLYGNSYNSMWINNNGNITFDAAYGTFSAAGFPNADNIMVAPFWADVDTRNLASGIVYYKITPTHAIIRWQTVGYYSSMADKLNDFQLIITDGNDPIIPIGTNTSFCYGEMQWTTGAASNGIGGFGGIPANVGANRGDGVDFIQFGRFDQPGSAFDGPFGNSDGIDFLDNKSYYFNACLGTSNTPPVVTGINICDSISNICVGDTIPLNFSFYSLEVNQIITTQVNVTNVPGFSGSATTGNTSVVTSVFIPTPANVGVNELTFTATDDFVPPASLTIKFIITVNDYPDPNLTLTGDTLLCNGDTALIVAQAGNDLYTWYPSGPNNDTLFVTQTGQYHATISKGFCTSETDTIDIVAADPVPAINGIVPFCANECITLTNVSTAFTSTSWSTGSTDPTVQICDSTIISVYVADQFGCFDTLTVNIWPSPIPTANFTTTPPSPGILLEPITLNDQSTTVTGIQDSIVGWQWTIPNGAPGSSTDQNPTVIYSDISDTTITLVVTNSFGCTDTFTINFEAVPPYIPDVFTPNGDGINETFVVPKAAVIDNCKLYIYSRWGKKIYQSDNYKNDWDGENHSDGVYFYVVIEPDGTESKGTVTILRDK